MNDFGPIESGTPNRRRDLIGLLLLALVAGSLIVLATALGGGLGD